FKDGDSIVNISQWRDPTSVGQINQFHFDRNHSLISITRAKQGEYNNQEWQLSEVLESEFNPESVATSQREKSSWNVNLEPQTLQLFSVEPEHLSSKNLYDYTRFLRANGLETQRYEVAFWSRIATSTSIVLMSLLALPFVFGSLRTGNTGVRLFMGVFIGISYMTANKMLVGTGEVYGLNAFLSAWLPTFLLGLVTFVALLRTR
ncbi:MAG: LptF/LptG family permease, partial [Gammaproteobacteria bacterium]|nr:LptF/LptG family permease [Gammaproteobacteria bacterium]